MRSYSSIIVSLLWSAAMMRSPRAFNSASDGAPDCHAAMSAPPKYALLAGRGANVRQTSAALAIEAIGLSKIFLTVLPALNDFYLRFDLPNSSCSNIVNCFQTIDADSVFFETK